MESIESYSTYLKKLNGEYKDNFEKVEAYCDVILDFDINTREEILSYILDDFLNAQKDNIPIQKIIGNDIIKYCDNVCSDIPFKYRIKKYIKAIEYYSWIVLIFICIQIFNNVPNYKRILDIRIDISFFIISLISLPLISSIIFKIEKQIIKKRLNKKRLNKNIKSLLNGFLFGFSICFSIFVVSKILNKYTNITFDLPILIVAIFAIVGIVLSKIIYRTDSKIRYYDINYLVDEELKNNQKRFKKINDRNIKNNKELVTESSYLKKAIKDYKNRKYYMSVGALIGSIILGIEILPDYSIKKVFYQLSIIILLLLLTKGFFSYTEKVNEKVIEKFQFFIDNNISVDDWKM